MFDEKKLIEIMEFAIPHTCAAKFNLDSYVPTANTKKKFIEQCEALERNEALFREEKKTKEQPGKTKADDSKKSKKKLPNKGAKTFFVANMGIIIPMILPSVIP